LTKTFQLKKKYLTRNKLIQKLLFLQKMSQLNASSCVDVGSGRPQQDAAYQNFKSNSNNVGNKGAFCEVTTGAAVVGELIADSGAFNDLVVNNLTVTGLSSGEPSVVDLPWQIATTTGSASVAYPGAYSFSAGSTVTWILNVPASTTRKIKFFVTGSLVITVNGVSVGTVAASPALTSAFNWPGGSMTVVAASAGTSSLAGDPVAV
jgi:hypothetical protein